MIDDTWQRGVLEAIERLVGTKQSAKLADAWSEHAERGRVEVTFLGPYSSGKSTLLRRLIIDVGGHVPEWLTVSGRRETFELNAVDVGELTFTDAPGFAAGNELHDELAHDALVLSDAFLLVVPPQLLTTDREVIGSVLSGRYFHGHLRSGVDAATIAVVAQADSMGIDPEDDVDGMRRLAERKRTELRAQLDDAAGVALDGLQTFSVAADPYEEQARQAQPRRTAFDSYRDWDGIDELTSALAALPARHDELRRAAGVRYFCRVGGDVATQADALIDEMAAAAEELRARQTAWAGQRVRVNALIEAARTNLQTILVELASELGEELSADRTESRSQADGRMTVAVDKWAQRWDGELDLALGEASMEVDDRVGRPRAERTEEFLRTITVGSAKIDAPEPNSRVFKLLAENRQELFTVARKTFEVWAGEPLDQLLTEGRKNKSAAAVTTAKKAAAKAADAKVSSAKVSKALALDAGLQLVDAVFTIATAIEAEKRRQELDEERRRQREAARDRIAHFATALAGAIVDGVDDDPGWRAHADAALETLRARLGLKGGDNSTDELLEQVAANRRVVSELRTLLAQ